MDNLKVSIPQAVWIACNWQHAIVRFKGHRFQYRKRYGLHAIMLSRIYREGRNVSIPQAVWIACNWKMYLRLRQKRGSFNTASGMDCMQYCLPEALETVSPKTEFLTMTPFSRFFPK